MKDAEEDVGFIERWPGDEIKGCSIILKGCDIVCTGSAYLYILSTSFPPRNHRDRVSMLDFPSSCLVLCCVVFPPLGWL